MALNAHRDYPAELSVEYRVGRYFAPEWVKMSLDRAAEGAVAQQTVVIGIATTGRADILQDTLAHLSQLKDAPDAVLLSVADLGDCHTDQLPDAPFPVQVLTAPKGLCAQRNVLLQTVPRDAILLFLDDDFLISDGFITATRSLFTEEPDAVMATGTVLADGILGPGMDHSEGEKHLPGSHPRPGQPSRAETYNGYGCNMAIRMSAVHDNDLTFDTTLPRYGWLEDVDFSRRLARFGRILKDSSMQGVHLGTKTGRSRGVPLGYSQIANPVYLIRKGTMAPKRALRLMMRNMAANIAKTLRPEPWVDRKGRVKGNALALRDLITGRLSPERILEL